jgi:hypothetical protein
MAKLGKIESRITDSTGAKEKVYEPGQKIIRSENTNLTLLNS